MSKPLFDDDDASSSSSEDEEEQTEQTKERFHVNKKFAKAYESRKQQEELRLARERGEDDESSSDESSEDEEGDLLTPSMDISILKTINALRNKDSSIYDPKSTFYNNEQEEEEATKETKKKHKKKHFKDVLREQILEQMEEEGISDKKKKNLDEKLSKLEYDEEQTNLRSAFLNDDDDDDDDDDDLLVVKRKIKPDSEAQEALEKEYSLLKKTATNDLKDPHGEVKDGDKFLLDFIKNQKWKDQDDDDDSDNEKVQYRSKSNIIGGDDDDDDDNDSIDDVDRADDFEQQYNFRFEEAQTAVASGADFSIVGYARSGTMDTLRRKDDSRRTKRELRKERKAAERKAKEEQLRRLKNAKREEMDKKLREIKKVVLGQNVDADELDEDAMMKLMEGDFDPDKFEEIMQQTYGDDFYQKEDAEWKSDAQVRESLLKDEDGNLLVGQDDADGGLYDNQEEEEEEEEEEGDDDDFVGQDDDDAGDLGDDALLPTTSASSKLEQKLHTKMQEELYKLDYEDIIGGMPTRFKYRQVEANSFGLSAQEILLARDTTLKNFVSLKKMAPYNDAGEFSVGHKKRRRFREMLKADLKEAEAAAEEAAAEMQQENEGVEEKEGKKKRRRQKKGKKKEKSVVDEEEEEDVSPSKAPKDDAKDDTGTTEDLNTESGKKRRRKKKGKKGQKPVDDAQDDAPAAETSVDDKVVQDEEEPPQDENSKKRKSTDDAKKARKKKRKKEKKAALAGVPKSRLAAYGL